MMCTSLMWRAFSIVIVALVTGNVVTGDEGTNCSQADLLIVLDSSGSIGEADYQRQLEFASDLATAFPIGPNDVQVAVMIFSSTVDNVFGFTTYDTSAEVKQAILNLPYLNGMTYTGAALRSARTFSFTPVNGARSNVPKIVVVVTDGLSTKAEDTKTEADLLRGEGVSVLAIGVGQADSTELRTIASSPSLVFNVSDYTVLDAIRSQVSNAVCQESNNPPTKKSCISEHGCLGKENGNYKACAGECEKGVYYSCAAEFTYRRECGFAYYKADNGSTFTARMVFEQESGTCQLESSYCPRETQNYAESQPIGSTGTYRYQKQPCLRLTDSCTGKRNGDYPLCSPDCESGNFISCSNNERYIMPCALGWYIDSNNQRYTAKMVFDADTGTCELTSSSCSRKNPPRTQPQTPGPEPSTDTPQCQEAADIALVIDGSGSVGIDNYEIVKKFMSDLTLHFTVGPENIIFSAIVFSNDANVLFNFDDFTTNDAIQQALLNAPYPDLGTDTAAAIRSARNVLFSNQSGARENTTKVCVLVTDGLSNNPNETAYEAAVMKNMSVTTIAVGVGPGADQNELLNIASSANHVFNVNSFTVLGAIRNALVTTACNNKATTAHVCISQNCLERANGNYPACYPDCQDGYFYMCSNQYTYKMDCALAWYNFENGTRFLAKMVYNPSTNTCEREATYCPRDPTKHVVPLPPSQLPVCHAQADVMFVVDSSASIGRSNYATLIDNVANLTRDFKISSTDTRVSIVLFSSNASIAFSFDVYLDNAEVYRAIKSMPYLEMGTNTAAALRLARQVGFTSANSARPTVKKLAIVYTDGISNSPTATVQEANLLKQTGATVMTIGIGSDTLDSELLAIASSPNLMFNVSNFTALNTIAREIVNTACQTATNTDSTTQPPPSCVSGDCSGRLDGTYESCPGECAQGYYYVCNNGIANRKICDTVKHTVGNLVTVVQGIYDPVFKACKASSSTCPGNY